MQNRQVSKEHGQPAQVFSNKRVVTISGGGGGNNNGRGRLRCRGQGSNEEPTGPQTNPVQEGGQGKEREGFCPILGMYPQLQPTCAIEDYPHHKDSWVTFDHSSR